jgi:hypothetical protein
VSRKTRAAAENLNPMGKPEQPALWHQLDPEEALDPWRESEEPELPTIPLTIGPAPGGPAGPASGADLETGRMAAELNWTVCQTDHQQKTIRVGDAEVEVDAFLAPLILSLNALHECQTITSCEGTGDTLPAYIMFSENGGREFAKIWHRRLAPLGYDQPVLDHRLRQAAWRREISRDYGFPTPIRVDANGASFTLTWRPDREELERLMPDLLDALDLELRGGSGADGQEQLVNPMRAWLTRR